MRIESMNGLLNIVKQKVKKRVEFLIRSDFFRETLWQTMDDLFKHPHAAGVPYAASPYNEVPALSQGDGAADDPPVFITARFRSGSTFFWQLFRHINGVRAFYEPLNQNQWFLQHTFSVDPTHIGVKDYAREYQGISGLPELYDKKWTCRDLYMSDREYAPGLYQYIRKLISGAGERPVLQFNRMDFRLEWLKSNFPNALILHLYRHPREQWMSVQKDGGPVSLDYRYRTGEYVNLFYLMVWARDLRRLFPFLEPDGQHPYAIHYYLWRMSYMYGMAYADMSISYENLVTDFYSVFPSVLEKVNISLSEDQLSRLAGLNSGKVKETWKTYAGADWFQSIESECDRVLEIFFHAA